MQQAPASETTTSSPPQSSNSCASRCLQVLRSPPGRSTPGAQRRAATWSAVGNTDANTAAQPSVRCPAPPGTACALRTDAAPPNAPPGD